MTKGPGMPGPFVIIYWLLFLVLGGGEAGQVFEVFAEGALVGEVQFVGYLLDVFAGEAEEVFCLEDYHVVNPLAGTAAGGLLYD